MSDYGIRISFDGKDVKTCSDLDTVVNSKYSNLKGNITGVGTISAPSGVLKTVTIAHGLGYIPFGRALHNYTGLGYSKIPYVDGNANYDISIISRSDSSNFYIDFLYDDYIGGSTATIPYVYFIFIDKGNLN